MSEQATSVTGATVGGHLTKKQRKEQFEALDALKTQLDVSVSLARSTVSSWLSADAFSDDEDSGSSSPGSFVSASAAVKPRQAGLGLGAKFISHKDAMRHVPLNAFESKLRRQLTGGVIGGEIQRQEEADRKALPDKYMEHKLMMAAKRKELQQQAEDEEDSRTRNIGATSASSSKKSSPATAPSHSSSAQSTSQKKQKSAKAYVAAVHPSILKAAASEGHQASSSASSKGSNSSSSSINKKRPTDFLSTYLDQRAEKMAKKKKKGFSKGSDSE
ncbi:hypothetical protein EMPS_08185 [Entomortierella parvispora]|uniref:Uncharacterized protein n=1 Tax=Entomortierella parvispora TaxID=205924 RepID=A0A9P3HGE8_9FUNG|nr:hypothetical protein EMPS_08185 [Entomortierella parvispora]